MKVGRARHEDLITNAASDGTSGGFVRVRYLRRGAGSGSAAIVGVAAGSGAWCVGGVGRVSCRARGAVKGGAAAVNVVARWIRLAAI